jgi:preprotein translocase subunit SecA
VKEIADELQEKAPKEVFPWLLGEAARFGHVVEALRKGVPHNVLNAKNHAREAHIVAQAGRRGAVTIATNMAGRGTDIVLGGNAVEMAKDAPAEATAEDRERLLAALKSQCDAEKKEVLAAGGLAIVGTERHEARRIDNQLRGRCARQGDPGSTRFYLSLQDDLMRIFARDWVTNMLKRLGMIEGQEIESGMVTRGIERAQKKVEQRNFEVRKNLLEYDEVMDKQRKTIYALRQEVLEGIELKERILDMCSSVIDRTMDVYLGESQKDWNLPEFTARVNRAFGTDLKEADFEGKDRPEIRELAGEKVAAAYAGREQELGAERMRVIEKFLLLNVLDSKWKDHLRAMTQLREQVGLRSYAQVDPKTEYKKEGYENFQRLTAGVEDEVTGLIFRIMVRDEDKSQLDRRWQSRPTPGAAGPGAAGASPAAGPGAAAPEADAARRLQQSGQARERAARDAGRARRPRTIKRVEPRVGRNDDCPCGSGKKYKKCCSPKFD